jgi:hypothetical protein
MPAPRLAPLVLAALLAAAPHAHAQTVIHGVVRDAETAGAIPQAVVVISGNSGRWQERTLADSTGAFTFEEVSPGAYRMRVTRIGYREAQGTLAVAADSSLAVELRMSAQTVVMQPVIVSTRVTRRISPILEGFYARMQHGPGRFITRAEMRERNPSRVTDMLRNIPNLRGTQRMGASGPSFSMGSNGGRCSVVFFVDGMHVDFFARMGRTTSGGGDVAIDDYVQPDEVEGIEIYRGESDTPAEFITRWVGCGTVVIWTRRG